MKFKIERKGYSTKEVDEFIVNQESKKESDMVKLRCELNIANSKIENLKTNVEDYKKREKGITKALESANDKASEIDKILIKRLKLENDRIKTFRLGWENYCTSIQLPSDNMLVSLKVASYLELCEKELDETLTQFFSTSILDRNVEEQFRNEIRRQTEQEYKKVFNDRTLSQLDYADYDYELSSEEVEIIERLKKSINQNNN